MRIARRLLPLLLVCALFCAPAARAVSYTLPLEAETGIYPAPGAEEGLSGYVGEDGVYTIVEEIRDAAGDTWGRLKSGAGWICLSALAAQDDRPISVCPAEAVFSLPPEQCDFLLETSEYLMKIALRAREPLTDVRFFSLRYEEAGYAIDQEYFGASCLEKGAYLVAGVVFPGDMTAYGVSFLDAQGAARCYALYMSGRDGSLILEELSR